MISVVCVYNNRKILTDYLLKGLKNQTVKYELILIENTEGQNKSAAEALNYGGKKTTGDYIMFIHQDVDLTSNSWLEDVEKMLDSIQNLGIAGVAGRKDERGVITVIKHGNPPRLAGQIQINNPTKVQTLDECVVIIPKSVFKLLQFDEVVCDDWHLYTVDYSLCVGRIGLDVYVIPMFVYHKSPGYSFSGKYYLVLEKVIKKHKKNYRRIYTTMGDWSTLYPLIIQKQRIWRSVKMGAKILFKKIKK